MWMINRWNMGSWVPITATGSSIEVLRGLRGPRINLSTSYSIPQTSRNGPTEEVHTAYERGYATQSLYILNGAIYACLGYIQPGTSYWGLGKSHSLAVMTRISHKYQVLLA